VIHTENKTFSVERGELVMRATPISGPRREPYRHVCPRAALEAVAHAIDEAGPDGINRHNLRTKSGANYTQVAVAMAFLVERGAVHETGRRGSVLRPAANACVHMEAVTEFHALREGG